MIFRHTLFLCTLFASSFIGAAELTQIADLFKQSNKYFGSSVASARLQNDSLFRNNVLSFSMVTAEYEMKMGTIQPTRGTFNYAGPDSIINFCGPRLIQLRGHTLVYAVSAPAWLKQGNFPGDTVKTIMKTYIANVAGHFRGNVYCWDVVNEAFSDWPGGLDTGNYFFKTLGPYYIDSAFAWTHAADPQAKLFYNDYYSYYQSDPTGYLRKMDSTYTMLARLKANGIRVDGIGVQMHMRSDRPMDYAHTKTWLEKCAALGLEIHFTELDAAVDTPFTDDKLREEGHIYADAVRLFYSVPACKALVVWGFTDRYSWIPAYYSGARGAACLLDSLYRPKPAIDSVYAVLRERLAGISDPPASPSSQSLQIRISADRGVLFMLRPAKPGEFHLEVLDVSGKTVWQYTGYAKQNGRCSIYWDNKEAVGNGVYMATLKYSGGMLSSKFIKYE